MKNIPHRLVVIIAVLFTCLATATSFASDKNNPVAGNGKSGIIGRIGELPGPWHIHIDTGNGKFVEDIQADNYGSFQVDLKPGTYLLTPFFPSLDGTAQLVGVTTAVTVEKKQFTTAILPIVQGPE